MADAVHGNDSTRHAALGALQALASALPDGQVGRRPRRSSMVRRRRREPAVGFAIRTNMTPMIDVVFQLLVFFIATTRYANDERVIAMDLARRTAAVAPAGAAAPAPPPPPPADPFAMEDEALRLEVRTDGTVAAGTPFRKTFTTAELRAALTEQVRSPMHPKGMFESAFPVVIAPAENAPWESAVEVLDAAVAAGFRNVGFERRPGVTGSAP